MLVGFFIIMRYISFLIASTLMCIIDSLAHHCCVFTLLSLSEIDNMK